MRCSETSLRTDSFMFSWPLSVCIAPFSRLSGRTLCPSTLWGGYQRVKCFIFHLVFVCFICCLVLVCGPWQRHLSKYWIVACSSFIPAHLTFCQSRFFPLPSFFLYFCKTEPCISIYFIVFYRRGEEYIKITWILPIITVTTSLCTHQMWIMSCFKHRIYGKYENKTFRLTNH